MDDRPEGTWNPGSSDVTLGSSEDKTMRYLKYFVILALLGFVAAVPSQAQVRVGLGYGAGYYDAPVCTYGYYGYAPYACAPYGYYGPSWFSGGIFIGAGPWFRGGYGYGYRGVYGYRGGYYGRPGYGYGRPGYGARPVPYAGGYRGTSAVRGGFAGGVHGNVSGGGFHGGGGGGFHGGGGGHGGGGHR